MNAEQDRTESPGGKRLVRFLQLAMCAAMSDSLPDPALEILGDELADDLDALPALKAEVVRVLGLVALHEDELGHVVGLQADVVSLLERCRT